MKQRQYKHRLNIKRRMATHYPWIVLIAPSAGEAYLRALTTGEGWYRTPKSDLIQGEIGAVDGGFRFITSKGPL